MQHGSLASTATSLGCTCTLASVGITASSLGSTATSLECMCTISKVGSIATSPGCVATSLRRMATSVGSSATSLECGREHRYLARERCLFAQANGNFGREHCHLAPEHCRCLIREGLSIAVGLPRCVPLGWHFSHLIHRALLENQSRPPCHDKRASV